ncbi:MAG: polysaccharide biosynthesis protein [Firmicutes bacterium]|nr:polysaccharide biosynthesis protein [Bacillota bacterium]MCM1393838.1 polysaccharide biosynthesis protein [[Eubacterium] siraeum]
MKKRALDALKRNRGRMLSGAAVLAVGSVLAKVLGALYRVPLTNILGAEGMGMYQLVFPVFALFMVLSTAGIPTALSRMVAEKRAEGAPTKKYLLSAIIVLMALGTMFAILTFTLSGQLAKWQGNGDTRTGFMIIAPTLILVSLIAGFRGWFQGEMYMLPTAISNIIEQVVKLAVGIGLSLAFIPRGVVAAVNGALLGIAASEACALAYLIVTYLVRGRKLKREIMHVSREDARAMFKVAFPIAIVAVLMPLSNFFDSVIIVNMLKSSGVAMDIATAQYGLLSGPVNSLINMPIVIIMSLAVVVVPSVSVSRVQRDIDGVMLKSRLSIKLAYLIGVPCAFFFMVFAPRLLPVIYPALTPAQLDLTVRLLRVVSANIVLLSSMQIYVSLLQALDRTKSAVISLACAIVVKVVLSVVLTKYIGIMGGALASFAMAGVAFLGVNIAYFKICGIHLEKSVGLNLLSGVIMALAGLGVSSLIENNIIATVVGFVACAAVYVWLAFLLGIVGTEEINYLPMKKVLRAVHRVVRFWEYKDES